MLNKLGKDNHPLLASPNRTYRRVSCGQVLYFDIAARGPIRRGNARKRWLRLLFNLKILLDSLQTEIIC